MSQMNTSLNVPGESKTPSLISKLPLINIESYDDSSVDKQPGSNSMSRADTKGSSSKKLAGIVGFKDENKLSAGPSLVKNFTSTSFYSPTQSSSPHNQSIRQRIGNVKPITPTNLMSNNDDNLDFSHLAKNRIVIADFNSPAKDSSSYLKSGAESTKSKLNTSQSIFNLASEDRPRPPNQKVQTPMRVSRSYLSNTSNHANGRALSHSPTNNQTFFASNLSTQPNKIPAITINSTPNNTLNKASMGASSSEANLTRISRPRVQSFGDETQFDKTLTNKGGGLPSASKNVYPSFFGGEKGQNESSIEKLKIGAETPSNSSFSSGGVGGVPGKNMNSTFSSSFSAQPNIWNNSQSQLGRGEYLENKIEKLLASGSTDSQHFDDISTLFDSFIDIIYDNGSKEGTKVRGMLRRIKLAYEMFFRNYSLSINKRLTEAQECHYKVGEYKKLVARMNEMNSEIELLRKENQKLAHQNKLLRSGQSPSNSSSSKYQPLSTDDSPSAIKSQIEALKTMIAEQQNTINSMKKKEAKMIKLLYACKKRGIDLEQVYHEELKQEQTTMREEEEASSSNKDQKPAQSNAHNVPPLQLQGIHQEQAQINSEASNEPDAVDTSKVTESDVGDKSSEMDSYCLYEQPVPDEKATTSLNPALKNKLQLDFTQLGIAKPKPPSELVNNEQKPNPLVMGVKKHVVSQLKTPALNLEEIKAHQDSLVGYHEEFMSKIGEFSESWRNAALNERKIP